MFKYLKNIILSSTIICFSLGAQNPNNQNIKDKTVTELRSVLFNLNDRFYCMGMAGSNDPKKVFDEILFDATQEIKKILASNSINPNDYKNEFVTLCSIGNKEIVDAIVAAKFDINQVEEKYKTTPLILSALSGNVEAVKALISNGANVFFKDNHGYAAKDYALSLPNKTNSYWFKIMGYINPFRNLALMQQIQIAQLRCPSEDPFKACRKILEEAEIKAQENNPEKNKKNWIMKWFKR